MKKRILSLALAIILVVAMGVPSFAAESSKGKKVKLSSELGGSIVLSDVLYTKKENVPSGARGSKENVTVYYISKGSSVTVTAVEEKEFGLSMFGFAQLYKKSSKEKNIFGYEYTDSARYVDGKVSPNNIGAKVQQIPTQSSKKWVAKWAFENVNTNYDLYQTSVQPTFDLEVYFKVVSDGENDKAKDSNTDRKFELKNLQSGIKSISTELSAKKLYDSHITLVNNQLVYLNGEFAAKKKVVNEAEIKKALKDLDKLLLKIDTSKLSVYTKPNEAKKTDKAGLDATYEKLNKLRKNLDRAMKSYGVK